MEKVSTHDYIGRDYTIQQIQDFEVIREKCKELELMLKTHKDAGKRTFSDKCLSIARTKLEECGMYAIKAIAFEGKEVE